MSRAGAGAVSNQEQTGFSDIINPDPDGSVISCVVCGFILNNDDFAKQRFSQELPPNRFREERKGFLKKKSLHAQVVQMGILTIKI